MIFAKKGVFIPYKSRAKAFCHHRRHMRSGESSRQVQLHENLCEDQNRAIYVDDQTRNSRYVHWGDCRAIDGQMR